MNKMIILLILGIIAINGCVNYKLQNVKLEPQTSCINVVKPYAIGITIRNNCSKDFSFYDYKSSYINKTDKILIYLYSSEYRCYLMASLISNRTCLTEELIPEGTQNCFTEDDCWNNACLKGGICRNILVPEKSEATIYMGGEGKWYLVSEEINISGELVEY